MESGCEKPPTKRFKWAEGMARAWHCDEHHTKWVKENPDDAFDIESLTNSADEFHKKLKEDLGQLDKAYLAEGKEYIPDPSSAPQGVTVEQGPKGGFYYEENNQRGQQQALADPPVKFEGMSGYKVYEFKPNHTKKNIIAMRSVGPVSTYMPNGSSFYFPKLDSYLGTGQPYTHYSIEPTTGLPDKTGTGVRIETGENESISVHAQEFDQILDWAKSVSSDFPPNTPIVWETKRFTQNQEYAHETLQQLLDRAKPRSRVRDIRNDPNMFDPDTRPLGKAMDDHLDDGMIAWYPPDEIQYQLAIEGGELPEDIHMTLAYFPDLNYVNPSQLIEELKKWALYQKPLSGELSGIGRFSGPDKDVAYVSADVPSLPELRQSLFVPEIMDDFEPAMNHGFTPHMTIKYLAADEPSPLLRLEPIPIIIRAISVVLGGNRVDILLGDGEALQKNIDVNSVMDMWTHKNRAGDNNQKVIGEQFDNTGQGYHNPVGVNRELQSENEKVEDLITKNLDDPTHVVVTEPVFDAQKNNIEERQISTRPEFDERGAAVNEIGASRA